MFFRNNLYIYGGSVKPFQVLELECRNQYFQRRTDLQFSFADGVCANNNELILLCFSSDNKRECWKSLYPVSNDKWWKWHNRVSHSSFRHKSVTISVSTGFIFVLLENIIYFNN